jgi:hypothetical protein
MNHTQTSENTIQTRSQSQPKLDNESVKRIDQSLRKLTREQPIVATLLALGAGFWIGRLVNKWR